MKYVFGPFELDVQQRQLRRAGVAQPLRSRPFDLLAVLVSRAGRLVPKDELLDLAWPGVVVEENNLQVQVSALRKILGSNAIATVPGHGYRFDLSVRTVAACAVASSSTGTRYRYIETSPIFGRQGDCASVERLLAEGREVTILGAGGIGKTRLARAVARAIADHSAEAVLWIDLEGIEDADAAIARVASALGADQRDTGAPLDALDMELAAQARLMVIDNAERVVHAVAEVVAHLLRQIPTLSVLVTSQVPLNIRAETVYRLEPLSTPPGGAGVAEAMQHSAVELLVWRVRKLDRHFVLRESDVSSAIAVCERLNGLPLAIELAAARVPLLGLRGLAEQFDRRFELLRSETVDAPARQQTLEAVLDWSTRLLSPIEQIVFRRLGVFAGTFDLDRAGEIAAAGSLETATVLDALGTLVDRSLVALLAGAEPAYHLLETPRAYALRMLKAAGEWQTFERGIRMLVDAGRGAIAAANLSEALAHLSAALDLACHMPDGAMRREQELAIALELGPVMQSVLGPAHPRCESVYKRALACIDPAAPTIAGYKAVWGYWHYLLMRGRVRDAEPYADRVLDMSVQLADEGLHLEAQHAVMSTQDLTGNARRTFESAQRVISLYDRDRHHALAFAFGGHDPGVCAYGQGAVAAWLLAEDATAFDLAERGMTLADSLADGYSRATGYYYASLLFALAGSTAALERCSELLCVIAAEHDMQSLLVEAEFLKARSTFDRGERVRALGEMRRALAVIESGEDLAFALVYVALLVGALLDDDMNAPEAKDWLQRAIGYSQAGQGLLLPEIYRLRGELCSRDGESAKARDCFARAHALAKEQGAVRLLRRAEVSIEQFTENVRDPPA